MSDKYKGNKKILFLYAIVIGIIILQWFQLQYSALSFGNWTFASSQILMIINIAIVCLPNILLHLILKKWFLVLEITAIGCSVWSVVSYYVSVFHGAPLSISELVNLKTALDVISGYNLFVDMRVSLLLIILVIELIGVFVLRKNQNVLVVNKKIRMVNLLIAVTNIFIIYMGLFSSWAVKPEKAIGWSWNDAVKNYGYLPCLIEDLENVMNPYIKPEGYNGVNVESEPYCKYVDNNLGNQQYPDIILILNESFYDLSIYTELEVDKDYMKTFMQIEDAVYGYAVTPTVGGGTNNSEYELLTSNSMALLSSAAPFNYVNLSKSDNNVVKYVKSLGYKTYGMHCAAPENYSRNTAYREMGFDEVFLGKEKYKYLSYYGNRPWKDSDNYKDMLELCEVEEDKPRFIYLLTYQNHGGYEQNEDYMDQVHVKNNYGDLTDDINEYLTSIENSCFAFKELTDNLINSERPTIVCMIGDHAPSFISELEPKSNFSKEEINIFSRMVPYVIWANYEVYYENTIEYASLVDIVPMLMNISQLPLSHYYNYILQMHEEIPIRTSDKKYMQQNNMIWGYESNNPYYDMLIQYYYMEYNGLKVGNDYKAELFIP